MAGPGHRLGIDFGTSHTVAVLSWPDGRTRPLLFDSGTPLLRSAVYADPGGELLVGQDAIRRAGLDPTRYEPHPKQRVDEPMVLLGDAELPVGALVSAILRRVAGEAVRVGGPPGEVVLTVPAAWGAPRRQVLLDAAAAAGLPGVRLLPEPVAAATYFATVLGAQVANGRPLAVFDFGGGTLDVAVVRRAGPGFEVLATGGLPDLGGVDLDAAIVRHLGAGLKPEDQPTWRTLMAPASTEQRRDARLLWDDVRLAKETLSRTTLAPVRLPGIDVEPHLTREEFESLAGPLLDRGITETRRVLAAANTTPTGLAGLYLVGGSSRVPLVARALHATLGVPPLVLEQPEVAVAEGAARPAEGGRSPAPVSAPTAALAPPPPVHGPHGPPVSAAPASPLAAAPAGARPAPPVGRPVPGAPGTSAPRRKKRRPWLLAIPAVVVALLVGTGIYVFGVHSGLSMVRMPSAMRGFASHWWTSTSSCRSIESSLNDGGGFSHLVHRTNDRFVNAEVGEGNGYVWRCDMTSGARDDTTADYVVFADTTASFDQQGQHITRAWHAEQRDPASASSGHAYVAASGKADPHAKLFWTSNESAGSSDEVVNAYLVSTRHGSADKLYQFWRQHA